MHLTEAATALLFRESVRRHFDAGDVILREGDVPTSLFWLASGEAAVRLPNWRGHDVILGYFGEGDFFGEMGMLRLPGTRTAMVRATRESLVLEIGYPTFRRIAGEEDSLWLALVGQLGDRLRDANRRLIDTGLLRVPERILEVLHKLAAQPTAEAVAGGHRVRISRQELAQLVGCTREVVSRAVNQLEAGGKLSRQGRAIVVPAASAATGERSVATEKKPDVRV